MLTAIFITLIVVSALGYALRSGRGEGALVRRPYNNRYNDASAASAQARTSGRICPSSSSECLPAASSLPASGYSPLKHASQWLARSAPTAS